MTVNPFACPNDPRCPHTGLVHDIYDLDDPVPRCCMEGCDCGKRVTRPCGCVTANGVLIRGSLACAGHPVMDAAGG